MALFNACVLNRKPKLKIVAMEINKISTHLGGQPTVQPGAQLTEGKG
jgi:hypothetical protein